MITIIKYLQIYFTSARVLFILVSLLSIWLFVQNTKYNNQKKQIQNELLLKNKQIDSLTSELFSKDIEIQRYDYILELLRERKPKVLEQILHETE